MGTLDIAADIKGSLDKIAAASLAGAGTGDGSNAQALAEVKTER